MRDNIREGRTSRLLGNGRWRKMRLDSHREVVWDCESCSFFGQPFFKQLGLFLQLGCLHTIAIMNEDS